MIFLNRFKINLSEIELKEGKPIKKWVQMFRLGHWNHPRYGKLKFTEEIFDGFVKSFNDRVRRVELAIDQEHKPEQGAVGWIKQVDNRGEKGFWALVEWTKEGVKLVADKVFQYLSGDFDYEWKDEETGKKYKNVLFGAALTNRPFIKGMSPINLSEYINQTEQIEQIRDSLQLAEDVLKLQEESKVKTDEQIMNAKDEDLTDEEKARKKELTKTQQLKDRAVAIGLAEDATEEEVAGKEKEKADSDKAKLAERAKAVGLADDATEEDVKKKEDEKAEEKKKADNKKLAEEETDKKKKADTVKKEEDNKKKAALVERAKAVGLDEDATAEEIEKAEEKKEGIDQKLLQEKTDKEIMEKADEDLTEEEKARKKELLKKKDDGMKINLSDIGEMETRLSEMREDKNADPFTVKLFEESIVTKKKLREERLENGKKNIGTMLKEHWKKGKLTVQERDRWESLLCNDIASGESSFRLSEKDEDEVETETTKKLSVFVDETLEARPSLIGLEEIALRDTGIIGNLGPGKTKEQIASEDQAEGKRVASKVTTGTKSAKAATQKTKSKADIEPKVNK